MSSVLMVEELLPPLPLPPLLLLLPPITAGGGGRIKIRLISSSSSSSLSPFVPSRSCQVAVPLYSRRREKEEKMKMAAVCLRVPTTVCQLRIVIPSEACPHWLDTRRRMKGEERRERKRQEKRERKERERERGGGRALLFLAIRNGFVFWVF